MYVYMYVCSSLGEGHVPTQPLRHGAHRGGLGAAVELQGTIVAIVDYSFDKCRNTERERERGIDADIGIGVATDLDYGGLPHGWACPLRCLFGYVPSGNIMCDHGNWKYAFCIRRPRFALLLHVLLLLLLLQLLLLLLLLRLLLLLLLLQIIIYQ